MKGQLPKIIFDLIVIWDSELSFGNETGVSYTFMTLWFMFLVVKLNCFRVLMSHVWI